MILFHDLHANLKVKNLDFLPELVDFVHLILVAYLCTLKLGLTDDMITAGANSHHKLGDGNL